MNQINDLMTSLISYNMTCIELEVCCFFISILWHFCTCFCLSVLWHYCTIPWSDILPPFLKAHANYIFYNHNEKYTNLNTKWTDSFWCRLMWWNVHFVYDDKWRLFDI